LVGRALHLFLQLDVRLGSIYNLTHPSDIMCRASVGVWIDGERYAVH